MPFRILALAWIAAIVYAYPGYLTADSTSALAQARGATLIDWHPPMTSILWRGCEYVVSGPLLMLLLQTGCLLFGVYGIARARLEPTPAAVVAAGVLLFPPVLAPMAVIWKDSQMAGFLAAGAALALTGRPKLLVAAAVALFLALSMRHNAAPAAVPIIVVAVRTVPALRTHGWRWCGAALGATVVLVALATGVNQALTEEKTHPWHRSLAVHDIAGTIRQEGPMTDAEVRDLLTGITVVPASDLQAHARALHNHNAWWHVTHGDERLIEPPFDAASRAAIGRAWRRAAFEHTGAWLRHRLRMWRLTMGLGGATIYQPVVHDYGMAEGEGTGVRKEVVVDYRRSGVQEVIGDMLDWLAETPVFAPWLYMFLAIGLVVYTRARGVVTVLAASGLGHCAGLFIAVPSLDFRYSHWTIASAVAAGLLAAFEARKVRGRSVPAWPDITSSAL